MEMLICVFIISFRSVSEGDLDRMSGSVFVQNEMLNYLLYIKCALIKYLLIYCFQEIMLNREIN